MPTFNLRKRCELVRPAHPISDGDYEDTRPVPVVNVWAELRTLTTTERVEAQQLYGNVTMRATIRWPGIPVDSGMSIRVVETGIEYPIVAVIDFEDAGRYLQLFCSAAAVPKGTTTVR